MGQVIISVIVLVIGLAGQFYMRKKSFDRRNAAGVEEFKSYGSALVSQTFEKIVLIVSGLLIVMGGASLLMLNVVRTTKS